jgi:hypothetical protein
MHKAETHLHQPDQHICKADWRITRREMPIANQEQGAGRRRSRMHAISGRRCLPA